MRCILPTFFRILIISYYIGLGLINTSYAQDFLYYKYRQDSVQVSITQVDLDKVSFKLNRDSLDTTIFTERKIYLSAIQFQDGLRFQFNPIHLSYDSLFSIQPKTCYKLLTPRWLLGSYGIGFEHLIKPRESLSLDCFLIIHPENSQNEYSFFETKGIALGLNRRLYFKSKAYPKNRHNFQGSYFIQSFSFISQYARYIGYKNFGSVYGKEYGNGINYTGAALTIGYGKQMVFANKFTLDVFAAAGLGIKTYRFVYSYQDRDAGYMTFWNTGAVGFALLGNQYNQLTTAVRAGINLGYIF
jgi:hypothetical protein